MTSLNIQNMKERKSSMKKDTNAEKPQETKKNEETNPEWPQDAQDELQDFIESQGIYIRQ